MRGHTILRRGRVRVFSVPGIAYGCLNGSTRAWGLWETQHTLTQSRVGSVRQVDGRFLAFSRSLSNQYGFAQSIEVVNLRNGASYTVATLGESDGVISASPASPGPQPLETFSLAANGRTVRLYDTFAASAKPNFSARPTGQVLDAIGFDHFRHALATSSPGAIAPGSVSYNGLQAQWTQNGVRHTAGV